VKPYSPSTISVVSAPSLKSATAGVDIDTAVPRELVRRHIDGSADHVVVLPRGTDVEEIRDDWRETGRVEFVFGGRAIVVELDGQGDGLVVIEPFSGRTLVTYRAARGPRRRRYAASVAGPRLARDGWVDGPNWSVRWTTPSRSVFDCGFDSVTEGRLLRFAHDGTAVVTADRSRHSRGATAEVDLLLVLGWFLLLVSGEVPVDSYPRLTLTPADGRPVVRSGRGVPSVRAAN
jgi:hypothetical protein